MEAPRPLAVALILLAGGVAYAHSLHVPFVFDDASAITANASIRHLATSLVPPTLGTTAGRPLLNLSFALNYALGGLNPLGYHLVNLAIHLLAGLTLFGLVRRLSRNDPLALIVALLWTVHPLQTEAVTYVSQRAECLMGLCYLLTLYWLVRGRFTLSVIACFCGMATKETMVTAPILAYLVDRIFLGEGRVRRGYHLALASSWVLLALLIVQGRTGLKVNAGFHQGVSVGTYLCTEGVVILRYLKLAIWPARLVFDYDPRALWTTAVLPGLVVVLLLTGVAIAWRRSPKLGFLAAAPFLLLAPTSSLVPIATCPMAESRMYLPLAALIVLAGLALRRSRPVAGGIVAVALCCATMARNAVYASPVALWQDTVAKQPDSARAHLNLAVELTQLPEGDADATAEFRTAVKLDPNSAPAHTGLANELAKAPGQIDAAWAEYRQSLALDPTSPETHVNLGNLLTRLPGRVADAAAEYREAIALDPDLAEAHFDLGVVLSGDAGHPTDAIAEFETALRLQPRYVAAEYNLAVELAQQPGGRAGAVAHYRRAIAIQPDNVAAHFNLGCVLAAMPGRRDEAIAEFKTALRLQPDFPAAERDLDQLLDSNSPGRR